MWKQIGFFVLVMGGLLSVSAVSAQSVTATVVPDSLTVREGPGTDSSQLGSFTAGTTVTVSGREDDPNNGGVWVVASDGNLTGWVLSDYLEFPTGTVLETLPVMGPNNVQASGGNSQPQNTAPPEGGIGATVQVDSNVRQQPTASSPRVTGAAAGTRITLVGRTADSSWVRAVLTDGMGWIAANLVAADSPITALPISNDSGSAGSSPAPVEPEESAPEPAQSEAGSVPPPVTGGASIRGFSFGAHVDSLTNLDLLASTGATWIKKQVRYNRGDPADAYAGLINQSHGSGFRILLGVVGSPGDISAGGEAYFQDFAGFLGGLAALGADALEVWNEPNLDREWPHGSIDPAQYTRLLALSYNAIKSNNPNTLVISGAPAPTGFFGGCAPAGCDDNVYISGMRAAGAGRYMDCVGAHYNEGVVSPSQTSGDPRSEYYTRYYHGMVNTYYRTFGKPICFTELGYLTPDGYGGMPPGFEWGAYNTLQEHAQWIADAVSLAAQSGRVRMVIIWNFNYHTPAGAPDPAGGYAMLRPDGTCPACDALKARR